MLEPTADGFRNYFAAGRGAAAGARCCSTGPIMLTLTAPEMTVLIGGMRALERQPRADPSTASSPTGPRR